MPSDHHDAAPPTAKADDGKQTIFIRPNHRVIYVRDVYAEYVSGASIPALAKKYGVSANGISKQFAACNYPLRPGRGRSRIVDAQTSPSAE